MAEERNLLEFLDTWTVGQFKREMAVDVIRIKLNPNTNHLFFTYGAEHGVVAKNRVPKNPMISRVKGDSTEENPSGIFYMLHEEGMGLADVDTL